MSVFAVLLLPFLLALTLGPRLSTQGLQNHCATNMDFAGPFGFTLNCDSWDFMFAAKTPGRMFEHESVRQSRPGLPLLAHVISKPLQQIELLAARFDTSIFPLALVDIEAGGFLRKVDEKTLATAWNQNYAEYSAYLLLNIVFLLLGYLLYIRAVGDTTIGICVIGSLLFYNDLVKAFVLSPHTQIVMILAATACALTFRNGIRNGLNHPKRILLYAGLHGMALLILPVFVLSAISWLLGVLCTWPGQHLSKLTFKKILVSLIIALILLLFPYGFWYMLVKTTTGSFYSRETQQYFQLVWFLDGMLADPVNTLRRYLFNIWFFVQHFFSQGWPVLLIIVATIGASVSLATDRFANLRSNILVLSEGLFLGLLFILFFSAVGQLEGRLAYPAIPPLIVAAGRLIQSTQHSFKEPWIRISNLLLVGACAVVAGHTLLKEGPFT